MRIYNRVLCPECNVNMWAVGRNILKNGETIDYYRCNECQSRYATKDHIIERKIEPGTKKRPDTIRAKSEIQLMPGARLILGRSQSGSK